MSRQCGVRAGGSPNSDVRLCVGAPHCLSKTHSGAYIMELPLETISGVHAAAKTFTMGTKRHGGSPDLRKDYKERKKSSLLLLTAPLSPRLSNVRR